MPNNRNARSSENNYIIILYLWLFLFAIGGLIYSFTLPQSDITPLSQVPTTAYSGGNYFDINGNYGEVIHEQELIAVDDYVDIYGKAAAQIDVLLNDDNSMNGQINIISVTPANMGAVLINYDNTLSYIAKDNVSGEDFFSYTISNANGTTASATVFLTLYSNNGDKSEIVTSNLNKHACFPAGIDDCNISDDAYSLTLNCSKFELIAHITGSTLELSLDTDLPDKTAVIFTADRKNWSHIDHTGDYSLTIGIPYIYDASLIADWKLPKKIDVSHEKWERKLHEQQQLMIDFNPEQFIFDDDYSSSYIDIWAAVPYKQNDSFSEECADLIKRLPTNIQYFFRDDVKVKIP
ncbi:MAG: Ig-like domain-containing protein [Mariprofundales bacterium]